LLDGPKYWPFSSQMRTIERGFPVLSSTVRQRPTGVGSGAGSVA
jgi:hypothetical protein